MVGPTNTHPTTHARSQVEILDWKDLPDAPVPTPVGRGIALVPGLDLVGGFRPPCEYMLSIRFGVWALGFGVSNLGS